jgi:hypothetical protein
MSAKRLCAAFYISVREGEPAIADLTSLEKIAREAGVVDLEDVSAAERERYGTGAMTGHWDGIPDQVVVDLERLSEHLLFEICFFRSSFLSLLSDDTTDRPVEEDPAVVLAYAFRDACQRLRPDVAFLVTRPPQADLPERDLREFVREQEYRVLSLDADLLSAEDFGLLYLDEKIARHWTPHPSRDDRDSLPVAGGKLVFRSRGWGRWF